MVRCYVYFMFLLLVMPLTGLAQKSTTEPSPYYLDFNAQSNLSVHDLFSASLNLQYEDRYGRLNELPLTLYNSKHEKVNIYALSKSYGLNHFNIDLGATYDAWTEKEIYTCEIKDETGKNYRILLRKKIPETADPSVSILVNPVHLKCQDLTGNLVDFYASIKDGKAPYTVNWYILNESRQDFLYQPREQSIDRPGNTVIVRVDKNPNYYVMVTVRDACGKEAKQMVYLVCEEKKKKVNTVFVEPLQKLPKQPKTIN